MGLTYIIKKVEIALSQKNSVKVVTCTTRETQASNRIPHMLKLKVLRHKVQPLTLRYNEIPMEIFILSNNSNTMRENSNNLALEVYNPIATLIS